MILSQGMIEEVSENTSLVIRRNTAHVYSPHCITTQCDEEEGEMNEEFYILQTYCVFMPK